MHNFNGRRKVLTSVFLVLYTVASAVFRVIHSNEEQDYEYGSLSSNHKNKDTSFMQQLSSAKTYGCGRVHLGFSAVPSR